MKAPDSLKDKDGFDDHGLVNNDRFKDKGHLTGDGGSRTKGRWIIGTWLIGIAAAVWIVAHAHYITDLSAFLPAKPTPQQQLLVDQLRDGPASRLVLVALEGGDPRARARISMDMARRLRLDAQFSEVHNGDSTSADADRDFLFRHRYQLSDQITAQRFSAAGLQAALADTTADLASSAGLMLKSLVPQDPTGEMLHIVDQLSRDTGPRVQDGVWVSADGTRTLMVAQSAAAGSDTDAQEQDLEAIRATFRAALIGANDAVEAVPHARGGVGAPIRTAASAGAGAPPEATAPAGATAPPSTTAPPSSTASAEASAIAPAGGTGPMGAITSSRTAPAATTGVAASDIQLRLSGPGVFAVAARAKIKTAAMRLSLISSVLVIAVLLTVYRSVVALGLGLLPVASGAVAGIAAVALGFGVVHGVTLGFGITLIGESVDYSIYFFIASATSWRRSLWPTMRLGMLTSVCGFASLLPSGFPGLAQLGLYSISGLIVAALVTRFVLPVLLPPAFVIRDVTPWGTRISRWRDAVRRRGGGAGVGAIIVAMTLIAAAALSTLYAHHDTLWNHELSALSPIEPAALRYDASLRADLGTADVLDLVVIGGPSLESVLRGAERAAGTLDALVDAKMLGGYDSPAVYVPSEATQVSRREALPDESTLRSNLRQAVANSDLRENDLSPFIADVQAARHAPLVTAQDLRGTSLATGFGALILNRGDHWSALIPLYSVIGAARPDIDVTRVTAALAAAGSSDAVVLDMKAQTDALYAGYLGEAVRLSLCGFALIVLLLSFALRSLSRVLRVLAPLVLAVLTVAAVLAACGQQLTILHLVGMLLIVAVGSNYALFFDKESAAAAASGRSDSSSPLTLASLAIANISTVIGFGLLAFSRVPVLEALGTTVAPGAFLALLFSAFMTSRAPPAPSMQRAHA
jgi:predicted exporter